MYHVTYRWNERENIYYAQEDRGRFTEQLQADMEQDQVILYACLMMVKYYHLLVETPLGNLIRSCSG